MAALLFEIWEDHEAGLASSMSQVRRDHDEIRKSLNPNAVLLHTFRASSDHEAFRIYYEFIGRGPWKPEPGWLEGHFTEDEAREQEAYLLARDSNGAMEKP